MYAGMCVPVYVCLCLCVRMHVGLQWCMSVYECVLCMRV